MNNQHRPHIILKTHDEVMSIISREDFSQLGRYFDDDILIWHLFNRPLKGKAAVVILIQAFPNIGIPNPLLLSKTLLDDECLQVTWRQYFSYADKIHITGEFCDGVSVWHINANGQFDEVRHSFNSLKMLRILFKRVGIKGFLKLWQCYKEAYQANII